MGCANRFCGSVNLIQMSVFVDAASAEPLGLLLRTPSPVEEIGLDLGQYGAPLVLELWHGSGGSGAKLACGGWRVSSQVAECPPGMAVSYVECDGKCSGSSSLLGVSCMRVCVMLGKSSRSWGVEQDRS